MKKREVKLSLTDQPAQQQVISPSSNIAAKKGADTSEEEPEELYWEDDEDRARWIPWRFECVKGYEAFANVGLRSVVYKAHGQRFEFVPECVEDVLGEKWEYSTALWCDK